MKLITCCVPMYNESESIGELYRQLEALADSYVGKYNFEFLFINDGSIDHSLSIVKELAARDQRIAYVDLSRNFGKEVAMLAGFDHCKGDAIIILDADLQHPPATIPQMITEWENGYQDVYGKRVTREGESWFKKSTSKLYYKILDHFSQVPVLPAVGDFRLLDRKCIDSMVKIRESQRYTKSMYMWIGFKKKEVEFVSNERFAGQTKWKLKNLIQLAVDGLVSDSTIALRVSLYSGIVISLISFVYMMYVLIKTLIFGSTTPGFPTLVILILFLSGSQLIFQGVMGEYIGKIYTEVKNRPPYLIQEYFESSKYGPRDKEKEIN